MDDQFKVRGKPGAPAIRRRITGVPDALVASDSIEQLYADQIAQKTAEPKKPKSKLKIKRPRQAKLPVKAVIKKTPYVLVAVCVLLGGFIIVRRAQTKSSPTSVTVSDETRKTIEALTTGVLGTSTVTNSVPTFDTLKPDADTPVGVQFDTEKGLAVYKDKIGNTEISISQQPYPETLKSNPAGVESLAKSLSGFMTSETVQTTRGVAHIVRKKDQSQTVILGSGEVLLFINSPSQLSAEKWVEYINSLQ
jgi:hypothetical protein